MNPLMGAPGNPVPGGISETRKCPGRRVPQSILASAEDRERERGDHRDPAEGPQGAGKWTGEGGHIPVLDPSRGSFLGSRSRTDGNSCWETPRRGELLPLPPAPICCWRSVRGLSSLPNPKFTLLSMFSYYSISCPLVY